jgi:hypothetical protein
MPCAQMSLTTVCVLQYGAPGPVPFLNTPAYAQKWNSRKPGPAAPFPFRAPQALKPSQFDECEANGATCGTSSCPSSSDVETGMGHRSARGVAEFFVAKELQIQFNVKPHTWDDAELASTIVVTPCSTGMRVFSARGRRATGWKGQGLNHETNAPQRKRR